MFKRDIVQYVQIFNTVYIIELFELLGNCHSEIEVNM